jgi:hypothetical protein
MYPYLLHNRLLLLIVLVDLNEIGVSCHYMRSIRLSDPHHVFSVLVHIMADGIPSVSRAVDLLDVYSDGLTML